MKHAGALTALCSPTVNCYRRLHSPWAADKEDWGLDDRFTSFRVKNYSKEATYVENRIPSGSCNPYVVLAATVAAGCSFVRSFVLFPPPLPLSSSLTLPPPSSLPPSVPPASSLLPPSFLPPSLPPPPSSLSQSRKKCVCNVC